MKIYRTPEQLKECRGYGGVYYIELTPEEIGEAYSACFSKNIADDIAQEIWNRISDSGKEGRFSPDWPLRCGESWCYEYRKILEANYHINECYMESIIEFTEKKLKELGFDPDTMEKEVSA